MLPPLPSPQTIGLAVLSFFIGILTKTVIPYEYKRLRRQSIESEKDVEDWETKALELLEEVRVRATNLRSDRGTDLEAKTEDWDDLKLRIVKHGKSAPDGVHNELVDDFVELSGHVASIPFVYKEFSVKFDGTIEEMDKIPFESEYDRESVKVGEDHLRLGPVIRDLTSDMLNDRILPMVGELEEKIEGQSNS
jgi:hypothetical protein